MAAARVLADQVLIADLRNGLKERFESPCTANNWSSFPNLPTNDPRIVYVFVIPTSTLSAGTAIVPVLVHRIKRLCETCR